MTLFQAHDPTSESAICELSNHRPDTELELGLPFKNTTLAFDILLMLEYWVLTYEGSLMISINIAFMTCTLVYGLTEQI